MLLHCATWTGLEFESCGRTSRSTCGWVEQGETLEVTDMGRPVAVLGPLGAASSALDRHIQSGRVRPAPRPSEPFVAPPGPRQRRAAMPSTPSAPNDDRRLCRRLRHRQACCPRGRVGGAGPVAQWLRRPRHQRHRPHRGSPSGPAHRARSRTGADPRRAGALRHCGPRSQRGGLRPRPGTHSAADSRRDPPCLGNEPRVEDLIFVAYDRLCLESADRAGISTSAPH